LQKERGVIEKMLKKHRKKCAPIKEHRKKRVKHDPLQKKARGESQSKECLENQTKIFHTLAHLDQVA
jgi:hypothetical protein